MLELLDLGSTVQRLWVTGADGVQRDVSLSHPDAESMLAGTDYLGATVGRYANRIADGRFTLDGRPVQVGLVDRGHHLHGGPDGFDRRRWEVVEHDPTSALLRLMSPDGDQGFPGELVAHARWSVDGDTVRLELEATTDAPTVVNLTSHLYLNLDGEGVGSVDHHTLRVAASAYLPTDAEGIPLPGAPTPVAGTPFDLREPRELGAVVRSEHPQLVQTHGLDHDLVLDGEPGRLRPVAWLRSERSGLEVELATDQPGLQVYSGNGLDGAARSASGTRLRQGDGIALEPQRHPDTPRRPDLGDAVLRPGETYRSVMSWTFRTVEGRQFH